MTERHDLEPIGKYVDALLERMGMPTSLSLAELVENWENVAGEPFAGVAEPVGLKDGELVVQVRDGAVASLLKYRVGPLLDRLTSHFGEGSIDRVRIRVGDRKKGL